ncbi:MAG: SIR2 family protein [Lentimicrobiaceae bacterium]|nr:SIR2 family protein [Lentimicrobiaceae bacterium]
MENELKRILELEDPILFLGAGFSLGAKTQNGKDFPTGNQLKIEIIKNLLKVDEGSSEYNDLIKYSLSDICDYCENEKSKAHLTDFLVDIFQNAKPASFHELVCEYPWKKIYTTNIDDIIETIYNKGKKGLLVQNFKRRSTLKLDDKTEYIKLHGCVNNPSESLTFSTKSYLDSMVLTKDYRFNSLSLDMLSEPIIFVGHDYSEINIDYYLKLYENSGYQSSRGKLFFINPDPSIIFTSKIKSLGAVLIKWDAESFFNYVNKTYSQTDNSETIKHLRTLKRFGFERLNEIRKSIVPISKYESNLYFGYEPNWKDIYDEWDFQDINIKSELERFKDSILKIGESGIFAVYGKGLSGKSTFLLRLGAELESDGYEVWQYTGKYFNYFELYKWIKQNPGLKYFALLYDNASHNYRDISRLINLVSSDQKLIVITTSRVPLHIRMRYSIVDNKHLEYYIEPKISENYATTIEEKLSQKGYLGVLKKYSDKDERINKIVSKNDVLDILFEITYGKGFKERLNKGLQSILTKDSDCHDFLIFLAIFEKLDIPYIPKELVSFIYGINSNKMLTEVEDYIKYSQNGDIKLRTGFFLISIIQSASKGKILSVLKSILRSISPQLDNNPRNLWNQIEASCIKEKTLRIKLNLKTQQIKEMLYELKDDLSGSYNYWLQLGISEQIELDFDKALNHFRQAEVINPGSYMVQNAIGRNYLRQANNMNERSYATKVFEEGEEIILDLINHREEFQVRAFSTHTYLYEKINFLKRFKVDISRNELKEMFNLLKKLVDKDPEDVMTKHISNYFMDYLKLTKRTDIVKIKYHDLSILKSMLIDNQMDINDIEIE